MAPSIPWLAGPQFLGVCFNWALHGILNLQVYLYYDRYPEDGLVFKGLVCGILIIEWVQTGLLTAAGMVVYVYEYGDLLALIEFHNAWFSVDVLCGIISATVQSFFAWRIYKLSGSRMISGLLAVLATIEVVASIITGVMEKRKRFASVIEGSLMKAATVWLSAAAAADVLIAISMVILLLKRKSGIARTDALINRMVRMVVETGSLTASISILIIVFANCAPLRDTLAYDTPALILTKLYSNTLLTNLNSRKYIPRQDHYVVELSPTGGMQSTHHVPTCHCTLASTIASSSGSAAVSGHLEKSNVLLDNQQAAADHISYPMRIMAKDNRRLRRNSIV